MIKIKELMDKRSKLQFSFLFIMIVIKSFLDGFGLGLIAPFITVLADPSLIFNHWLFQKINVYTNIISTQQLILWMSILVLGFFVIKNLYSLFVIYCQDRLVFTKRSYMGKVMFEAYMNASYNYHLDHNSAELDRNIRFASSEVYSFVGLFLKICSNVFLTVFIFIVLIIANWQAVLTMGLVIVIFSSIIYFFSGKYSYRLGKIVHESNFHLVQAMKEGLSSIIEIKVHQIESFFPARYFKYMMANAKANWRKGVITSVPNLFFEILAVGTLVSATIVLSIRNVELNTVLPMIGLFSFAFIRLIPSVTNIIKNLQDIKFLGPAVSSVHADLKNLDILKKQSGNGKITLRQSIHFHSLSFENVSFSFSSKRNINVIKGVTFKINKGQAIGITGPSGSGKSTLINMILGLLKPSSGQINVNGKESQINLANFRSILGYVPQFIALIDASIRENIALGLGGNEIDNEKVWSVLKETKLAEFVKNLPEQLDTFIGENGMHLSGGQRQRLGLARALYRDPEVLIFDEATSALDVETEKRITKEVMKLSGKRTLIIVAHRISTIKNCDIIYYLKNGKIVNSGKFNELKALNTEFRNFSLQSEAEIV